MTTTALRMVGTLLVLAGFAVLVGAIPLPTPGGTAAPAASTASEAPNPSADPASSGDEAEQASVGDNDAISFEGDETEPDMEAGQVPAEELGAVDSCDLDDSCDAAMSDDNQAWDEDVDSDAVAVDLQAADTCDVEDECDLFAACGVDDEWCEE